jgi:hypothetical protein
VRESVTNPEHIQIPRSQNWISPAKGRILPELPMKVARSKILPYTPMNGSRSGDFRGNIGM